MNTHELKSFSVAKILKRKREQEKPKRKIRNLQRKKEMRITTCHIQIVATKDGCFI